MVDYKAIADGDQGGDLRLEYERMLAEMVTSTPMKRMNYRAVAKECNYNCATKLAFAIKSAVGAGSMPAFVEEMMNDEGLDVNDAQVRTQLAALVASPIDYVQADMDELVAAGVVQTPKYPNMRMGYLQNAREKRAKELI